MKQVTKAQLAADIVAITHPSISPEAREVLAIRLARAQDRAWLVGMLRSLK